MNKKYIHGSIGMMVIGSCLTVRGSKIMSWKYDDERWGPDSVFRASRPSLPAAWLARLLTKVGDVESNLGPTTHINKHT